MSNASCAQIAPDIVVDATGPFQQYVGDPYGVVRAAIAFGIGYLDLSDGAAFVRGIAQFDEAARRRNVFVLSGVSSCPVLTAAAVRRLAVGLTRIDSIAGGIAPSPFANVGLNVIRAIAGYAGKPVTLVRDGRPATGLCAHRTRSITRSRRRGGCRFVASDFRWSRSRISTCCRSCGRTCARSGWAPERSRRSGTARSTHSPGPCGCGSCRRCCRSPARCIAP